MQIVPYSNLHEEHNHLIVVTKFLNISDAEQHCSSGLLCKGNYTVRCVITRMVLNKQSRVLQRVSHV